MISGMEIHAQLVASVTLPAAFAGLLEAGPAGRRLVATRTPTSLAVYDLDRPTTGAPEPVVSFPAPWPARRSGIDAVAPDLALAVFAGMRSLRAVTPDGRTVWEIPHACWGCGEQHAPDEDLTGDLFHRRPDHGSAGFSADGTTVRAHIRVTGDTDGFSERWLVIDPADGTILAQAGTDTCAAGSRHVPHPDPALMGLSVGVGQDGAPALWGRHTGGELVISRLDGDDRILLTSGPGGETFLARGHEDVDELTVHRTADLSRLGVLRTGDLPPAGEGTGWDHRCGPVDDTTVVAGTSDHGQGDKTVQHWLIDIPALTVRGPVRYPVEAGSSALGLNDGTWLTTAPGSTEVSVWRRLPPVGTEELA
jgi:hypothetical protein